MKLTQRRVTLGAWLPLVVLSCLLASSIPLPASPKGTPSSEERRTAARVPAFFAFAAPQGHEEPGVEHAPADGAAEHASANGEEHAEGHGEEHSLLSEVLHWFNFFLVVAGLWLFGKKILGPYFDQRARAIREDMDRSAKTLADAEQRLAVVEDKLKNMNEELASLREAARHESVAEQQRIEQAAQAESEKILANAEMEIAAAVKTARDDLKVYTAQLALGLAEKRIRESLSPVSEQRILKAFVKDLAEVSGNDGTGSPAAPGRQE